MKRRVLSVLLATAILVSNMETYAWATTLDAEIENEVVWDAPSDDNEGYIIEDNVEDNIEDNIEDNEDDVGDIVSDGSNSSEDIGEKESVEESQESEDEESQEALGEDTDIDTEISADEGNEEVILEEQPPLESMTQSFIVDTESPYDGDYLLVANVSTYENGEAEAVGELPAADMASYSVGNSVNYAFSTNDPNVYDFDENGRGLIDPDSFLEEPVLDEYGIDYHTQQEEEPANYYIGYERVFYLNDTLSGKEYNAANCVCAAISDYCTVWVPLDDPIYIEDPEKMQGYMDELAQEFDAQYPKMTKMFGSNETIDRLYGDNDGRTALICYDINGNKLSGSTYTAGYFYASDVKNINYTFLTNNNIDCLHIDSWQGMNRKDSTNTLDPTYSKRTIVHEFQHLINYSVCRDNETKLATLKIPTYLNEAYSEAAAHLCYGEATARISNYNSNTYIDTGKVSLFSWGTYSSLNNYALSYLFSQYIRTQYEGGSTIYKDTMNDLNESNDLLSVIADKLEVSTEELLLNFRAALFLKSSEGPYGFGGEEWAESIKSRSTKASEGLTLVPGAAVVVPMNGSFEPSGEGDSISFLGMYSELTQDDIEVNIYGENTTITEDAGQLQLSASVSPECVSQSVVFTLPYEADRVYADVTEAGLVSAKANGTITVRAVSVYNPSRYADITINITGQNTVDIKKSQSLFFGGIIAYYSIVGDSDTVLYYTMDGTEPTVDSEKMPQDGLVFDEEGTYKVRILAHDPDEVYRDSYELDEIIIEKLAEPVITTEAVDVNNTYAQCVTIEAQDGAEVYYTMDSSEPDINNGIKYDSPFTIDTAGTVTVKAVAIKEGAVGSDVLSYDVTVYEAIVVGKSQSMVLGGIRAYYTVVEPEGIELYYTINGDVPATEDELVPEDGIFLDTEGKYTIKVLAHDPNEVYRDIYEEDEIVVEKLAEPVITAETENAAGSQRIEIKAQGGAVVYYTIDGSDPYIDNGIKYDGAFEINTLGTTLVKAVALKEGMESSVIAQKEVTVQYAYDNMIESEIKPYMTQVSFTMNKKFVEGTRVSILPIMNNEIIDAEIMDDSAAFSLERIEGTNDWYINLTDNVGRELENKTYNSKVRVISKAVDNIVYADMIDIKVKITDVSPKVSLKAVKINTYYPLAGYPLSAASKSGNVEIVGIDNGNSAGFTDNFKIVDGALYLNRQYDDFVKTAAGKPVLSGILQVKVEGYMTQELALTVKTLNKAPTLTASTASIRLNYDKLSEDKSFQFTLDNKLSSKEKVCLEDIKNVSLNEGGGAAYQKAAALIQDITCNDGKNIVVNFKDVKSGTYTLPLLVSAGTMGDSFSNVSCKVKIIIEKESAVPVLKLSATKLQLNRQTSGEKAYIPVKSVTQYNMRLTDIQCECATLTQSVNKGVSLSYDAETRQLKAEMMGEPEYSTYKFVCTPVYNGVYVSDKPLIVTVIIIDKAPSVTLKAKGSIDVLNRDSTTVTYTVKKSNFTDEIVSVEFEGASKLTSNILDARECFNDPILAQDTVCSISAKDDVVFTKGVKYAFRLKFVLKDSQKSVVTKDIIIKPKQSSVKLTTTASPVFYTYVSNKNNTQHISLKNSNGTIERIEWNFDDNKKIPEGITPVIEDGELIGITFDGGASIKKGKYKLAFRVYYKGQMWEKSSGTKASHAKPVVFRLTATVK